MSFAQFEPSRNVEDFHLSGFAYYDGLDVVGELTPGTLVELRAEPTNPYDYEAVAIFYQGKKLGYIPKDRNTLISRMMFYGHGEILEARIQMVDLTVHPERQLRVVVKFKDNR
ncbi:HIRAN domain-containing protein [Streptococcus sp. E17BB]|uniref:HIRAN domain-containing protein n=1 Tax=Streptococcus sp. E17BB TaxID=3278714 RepID=UPI00359D54B3